MLDGRSILEIDLNNLAEKNWRRPGADISDWFNYGFDEISWEAYCYRRREVDELANVLKTNVLVRTLFFRTYPCRYSFITRIHWFSAPMLLLFFNPLVSENVVRTNYLR